MSLQHPEFDRFKLAFAQLRFEDALHCLNALILLYPQSMALHWHQANVLEKLGRVGEARCAIEEVLKRRADFAPALLKLAEFNFNAGTAGRNGLVQREQTARMLESAIANDGRDRELSQDVVAQAVLSAAGAVRRGKSLGAALDARISDDPEQMLVISIAAQILNVANEPAPGLVEVEAIAYPAYQRKFIENCKRELCMLGLHPVAYAEAQGMALMLGQRVLLGFFADDSGETGVACFAMKPKWPGWLGFLILFLSGKWKAVEMTECVSQFDDGAHLSTQFVSPSAFEFGPPMHIEKLPRTASLTELVTRHSGRIAEYQRAHSATQPMCSFDLHGIEQRWISGQDAKKSYRASIGYITDTELKGLLGPHYGRLASKVREQVKVLATDL